MLTRTLQNSVGEYAPVAPEVAQYIGATLQNIDVALDNVLAVMTKPQIQKLQSLASVNGNLAYKAEALSKVLFAQAHQQLIDRGQRLQAAQAALQKVSSNALVGCACFGHPLPDESPPNGTS